MTRGRPAPSWRDASSGARRRQPDDLVTRGAVRRRAPRPPGRRHPGRSRGHGADRRAGPLRTVLRRRRAGGRLSRPRRVGRRARRAAGLAVRAHVAPRPAAAGTRRDAVRLRPGGDRAPPARLRVLRAPARGARTAGRRWTTSCSTAGRATASTSPARWRCCCGWAASPRASPPGSAPAGTPSARTPGSCATPTRTPGWRRGSTRSAGSRSTRRRRPRPPARRSRRSRRRPPPALSPTRGEDAAADAAGGGAAAGRSGAGLRGDLALDPSGRAGSGRRLRRGRRRPARMAAGRRRAGGAGARARARAGGSWSGAGAGAVPRAVAATAGRSTARSPSSSPRCAARDDPRRPVPPCASSSSASAARRRRPPTCARCGRAATRPRRQGRRPRPSGGRCGASSPPGLGLPGRLRALWALPPWPR